MNNSQYWKYKKERETRGYREIRFTNGVRLMSLEDFVSDIKNNIRISDLNKFSKQHEWATYIRYGD